MSQLPKSLLRVLAAQKAKEAPMPEVLDGPRTTTWRNGTIFREERDGCVIELPSVSPIQEYN